MKEYYYNQVWKTFVFILAININITNINRGACKNIS